MPVIDNARVTVRDILWSRASPDRRSPMRAIIVILFEQGGRIRIADGHTSAYPAGNAVTGHGGATSDTALDAPAREIVVEVKDSPSNTVPNTTGLPPAFPREGSQLVLETGKARVWNYAWIPGKPTPMHFHDTEVVVAYLRRWRHRLDHPGRQGGRQSPQPGRHRLQPRQPQPFRRAGEGRTVRHHAGTEIANPLRRRSQAVGVRSGRKAVIAAEASSAAAITRNDMPEIAGGAVQKAHAIGADEPAQRAHGC